MFLICAIELCICNITVHKKSNLHSLALLFNSMSFLCNKNGNKINIIMRLIFTPLELHDHIYATTRPTNSVPQYGKTTSTKSLICTPLRHSPYSDPQYGNTTSTKSPKCSPARV